MGRAKKIVEITEEDLEGLFEQSPQSPESPKKQKIPAKKKAPAKVPAKTPVKVKKAVKPVAAVAEAGAEAGAEDKMKAVRKKPKLLEAFDAAETIFNTPDNRKPLMDWLDERDSLMAKRVEGQLQNELKKQHQKFTKMMKAQEVFFLQKKEPVEMAPKKESEIVVLPTEPIVRSSTPVLSAIAAPVVPPAPVKVANLTMQERMFPGW